MDVKGSSKEAESKFLTFSLMSEEYGIEILHIREIIGMMKITSIPKTPDFLKGVVNLRGKVIPVIDLRLRFQLPPEQYNERTCIIVVEVEKKNETIIIGIVVDSVSEVLSIKSKNIEDAPVLGTELNTGYILGMAKIEDKVKILLDISNVLEQAEINTIKEID